MSIGRNPKDFWSGVLFVAFGTCAVYFGAQNPIGSTVRMGPGAFPVLLGSLSIVIGAVLVVRAFIQSGPPIERITFLRPGLILMSIAAFALLLQPLGLIAATTVLVLISALASQKFRMRTGLTLGLGLGLGSTAVFVWGLGLPIPVVGYWLAGP